MRKGFAYGMLTLMFTGFGLAAAGPAGAATPDTVLTGTLSGMAIHNTPAVSFILDGQLNQVTAGGPATTAGVHCDGSGTFTGSLTAGAGEYLDVLFVCNGGVYTFLVNGRLEGDLVRMDGYYSGPNGRSGYICLYGSYILGLLGPTSPGIDFSVCGFAGMLPGGVGNMGPRAHAGTAIGSSTGGNVCTGTRKTEASGTVGGSAGGNVGLIRATVYASVEGSLLESYTFACDFTLLASGSGSFGFMRYVHGVVQNSNTNTIHRTDGCSYDGVGSQGCSTPTYRLLQDSLSGRGLAGPGGGTTVWPLPTQVQACPPTASDATGEFTLTVFNENLQGLPAPATSAPKDWNCQVFAIHYTAA